MLSVLCFLALAGFSLARPSDVIIGAWIDSPYIMGGELADPGDFPWQLSLEVADPAWRHTCAAILLNEYWVMTAAHCVYGREVPANFRVKCGAHDRTDEDDPNMQIAYIATITMHEDYEDSNPWPNDIAVMSLTAGVTFDDFVQPAILPSAPGDDYVGWICWISGWGIEEGDGSSVDILKKAAIDVIDNVECQERFDDHSGSQILDVHICIFDSDGLTDTSCSGDSGGPLQCKLTEEDPYIVGGITSWGPRRDGVCVGDVPSVYCRVSLFIDWIADNTASLKK